MFAIGVITQLSCSSAIDRQHCLGTMNILVHNFAAVMRVIARSLLGIADIHRQSHSGKRCP